MFLATLKTAFSYLYRHIKRLGEGTNAMIGNRRALRQLYQLDDRTLADIGIVRGSVASHELWSSRWDSQLRDPHEARRRLKEIELEEAARLDIQPSDPIAKDRLRKKENLEAADAAELVLKPCSASSC